METGHRHNGKNPAEPELLTVSRLMEWLDKFHREHPEFANDPRTSKELIDELYDPETGLPI
jgi:hypothetical protein